VEPFFSSRWGTGTVGVQGKMKTLGTLIFLGFLSGEAGI